MSYTHDFIKPFDGGGTRACSVEPLSTDATYLHAYKPVICIRSILRVDRIIFSIYFQNIGIIYFVLTLVTHLLYNVIYIYKVREPRRTYMCVRALIRLIVVVAVAVVVNKPNFWRRQNIHPLFIG